MRRTLLLQIAAMATVLDGLAACALIDTRPPPVAVASRRAIQIKVGPCFGFCPVYDLLVEENGQVSFEGHRHTALLGLERRSLPAGSFEQLERRLAPLRPVRPGPGEPCETEVSDQSLIVIFWLDNGREVARREHDRGCRSMTGASVEKALLDVLEMTGARSWASQVTRSGAARG